jgi:ribose transport system ATP-binding protein
VGRLALSHGPQHEAQPLLVLEGIVKQFTGTLALDHVDFDVRRGEIHALLGQNGAGKSTLIKILAGIYPPTAGRVRWKGEDVVPGSSPLPITFIHQDLGLVDTMTVAENVAILAGYPRRNGIIDWRAAATAARDALVLMDSRIDPEARVGTLSAAEKSIVAIARALATRCDLLVLDEPTAALPAAEVDLLLTTLQRLKASGIGLIYVTHRLDEVFRIADRVTVLRDGRRIATRDSAATTPGDLVEWIVGGALAQTEFATTPASDEVLLALDGLVVGQEDGSGFVGPVSLSVRRGETLGLVGLRGAGHHALGRALFGALKKTAGTVRFKGAPIAVDGPNGAIRSGIGFVSSRRAEESLAGGLSVLENLYLYAGARGVPALRPVNRLRELVSCRQALARFSVRPPNPLPPIVTLSGGNQQKVVVARWMESQVELLVLEEPTIGVDVGSKAEIYRDLDHAHERGRAILLISSDFEEVEKVCHRALVFNRGRVTAELHRPDITVGRLTALAAGAHPTAEVAA